MVRFGSLRAVLALLAVAGTTAVETGRWRYGSVSWKRKDPEISTSRKVIFTVESAWRYSHGSMVKFGTDQKAQAGDTIKILASDGQDPLFAFGDGNVTARYDVEVVHVDPIQDLLMGRSTFEWDYWARGPWEASLTLCCRVAENQNGMKSILLSSTVDLTDLAVHGSPRVRIIPRLALQAFGAGDVQDFEVPTSAAEGFEGRDGIVWEDASLTYYNNLVSLPPNSTTYLGVNQTTGMASVDVRCYRSGACVHDLHIAIKVSRNGASGMVDFIVRVQRNVGPDVVPDITLKAPVNNPVLLGRETSALRDLPKIDAFAEFPVVLTFKGKDQLEQEIFFEYNMLPTGAVIGAKKLVNSLDRVYAQEILWTPSDAQVGEHYICGVTLDRDPSDHCTACTLDVANDETTCVPFCPPHLRSKPLCFDLQVYSNGSPMFSLPVLADQVQVIDMNFPFEIKVQAGDANWMDPVTLAVDGVHPDGSSITPVPGEMATFMFKWTPARSFGGWSQDVCFRAADSGAESTRLCMSVSVNSCRWHASAGQSLDSIATLFGSNYVQMWALNPERNSPDQVVKPADKVAIGHKYQLRATDNFRYLAVQFATTRATIEMLNLDLVAANSLLTSLPGDKDPLVHWAGREICILPHSCVDHSTVVAT